VIFVDTSFWVAATVEADARHADAVRLTVSARATALLTSNHVRGETWTFMRRRFGHLRAVAVVDRIDSTPRVRTVTVGQEVEDEAWAWLRRRDEREYSFVDATSFALMRKLGVREALAFDGDFAAAGFVELRP
jgi:predicted nucleic acid-binding protein